MSAGLPGQTPGRIEMKPKLYVGTTIPSYLTSWPSRDLIIAGHQQITREWWEKRREAFRIYISQLVVDEASAGDPVTARERMKVIREFPLLDITPDAGLPASEILASGIIPRKAATDAAHIAIAAVDDMDFLRTWNCVPIANTIIAKQVANICKVVWLPVSGHLHSGGTAGRIGLWRRITSSMTSGAFARHRPPNTVSMSKRSWRRPGNDNAGRGTRWCRSCQRTGSAPNEGMHAAAQNLRPMPGDTLALMAWIERCDCPKQNSRLLF